MGQRQCSRTRFGAQLTSIDFNQLSRGCEKVSFKESSSHENPTRVEGQLVHVFIVNFLSPRDIKVKFPSSYHHHHCIYILTLCFFIHLHIALFLFPFLFFFLFYFMFALFMPETYRNKDGPPNSCNQKSLNSRR